MATWRNSARPSGVVSFGLRSAVTKVEQKIPPGRNASRRSAQRTRQTVRDVERSTIRLLVMLPLVSFRSTAATSSLFWHQRPVLAS